MWKSKHGVGYQNVPTLSPSCKAVGTLPGTRGISCFVLWVLQPVQDKTVVSHGKVTFVLSAFLVVYLRQKYIVAICFCLNRRVPEGKEQSLTSRKGFEETAKVTWQTGLIILSFTTLVSFICVFSWDFSSYHTQMNFHQFTSPRRDCGKWLLWPAVV